MGVVADARAFLESNQLPIVDVRSPGEFQQGHIPHAKNVPLLDDAERAEIGKLYKKSGTDAAIARGHKLVGIKIPKLLDAVGQIAAGTDVLVHCWRGGLRSEGFAGLLEENGFQTTVLRGGYKAYRKHVHDCLAEPRRIVILSGHSGAGKTRLLKLLSDAGEQVIDLERLASHRGSVFGGIDLPPQPTVEQFENNLWQQWRELDPDKPVWIEGESQSIGRVFIPHVLWKQMSDAPSIFVQADRDQRVQFLVEEYGQLPAEDLAAAIGKISKRLGGARLRDALEALDRDDVHTFAGLALEYYDKAYMNALNKRPREVMVNLLLKCPGEAGAVDTLRRMGAELA